MNNQTSNFINELKKYKSKREIVNFVNNTHDRVKNEVLKEGIKVNPKGEYFEDHVAQQMISSKNKSLVDYYAELTYLKEGLNKGWVASIDAENLQEIKTLVTEITDKLI